MLLLPQFCENYGFTKITSASAVKAGDIIFFCTITYKVATSNKNSVTHTYTFTINPRVGDYKVGA